MILHEGFTLRQSAFKNLLDYALSSLLTLSLVVLFFAVWQFASLYVSEVILPKPLNTLEVLWQKGDVGAVLLTLKRALTAIFFAYFGGVCLGILAANFKTFARAVKPFIDILQGIAPIAWVVLALFWFGVGDFSVVFTCFVTLLPLSFGATFASIWQLDEGLSEVCKAYKFGFCKKMRLFWLPSILPFLLSNFSIVFAMGVKIAVMSELLGASDGVGAKIFEARNFLDAELIFTYIIIMVAVILLFEALIIKPLKIIFLPWQQRGSNV